MPAPTYYPFVKRTPPGVTGSEDFVIQPALLDLPPARPAQESPLQKRFEEFHAANPQVYAALRDLALARKALGFERWSIKAAWELLRWEPRFRTRGESYKLCNSLHSFYARLLMAQEPRLAGFFVTKRRGE